MLIENVIFYSLLLYKVKSKSDNDSVVIMVITTVPYPGSGLI